jgi:hypothetical protein
MSLSEEGSSVSCIDPQEENRSKLFAGEHRIKGEGIAATHTCWHPAQPR